MNKFPLPKFNIDLVRNNNNQEIFKIFNSIVKFKYPKRQLGPLQCHCRKYGHTKTYIKKIILFQYLLYLPSETLRSGNKAFCSNSNEKPLYAEITVNKPTTDQSLLHHHQIPRRNKTYSYNPLLIALTFLTNKILLPISQPP